LVEEFPNQAGAFGGGGGRRLGGIDDGREVGDFVILIVTV
jgi:hypothetical protein